MRDVIYPDVDVELYPRLTLLGRAGQAIFQKHGGAARNDYLNDLINSGLSFEGMIKRIQEYVNVIDN